jgi:hypothetical protein
LYLVTVTRPTNFSQAIVLHLVTVIVPLVLSKEWQQVEMKVAIAEREHVSMIAGITM